jgi:hypothetical protein
MAVLAECRFDTERNPSGVRNAPARTERGAGPTWRRRSAQAKSNTGLPSDSPRGKQRFEKIAGEKATSIEYAKDAEAKRKGQR